MGYLTLHTKVVSKLVEGGGEVILRTDGVSHATHLGQCMY